MQERIKAVGEGKYYSAAIIANGLVYVSGQGPIDPENEVVIGSTIEEQTRVTFENIERILEEVGLSFEDIVKVNVYLQNIADFDKFNKIYKDIMPVKKPARTTVGVDLVNILIEVDCVAILRDEL